MQRGTVHFLSSAFSHFSHFIHSLMWLYQFSIYHQPANWHALIQLSPSDLIEIRNMHFNQVVLYDVCLLMQSIYVEIGFKLRNRVKLVCIHFSSAFISASRSKWCASTSYATFSTYSVNHMSVLHKKYNTCTLWILTFSDELS